MRDVENSDLFIFTPESLGFFKVGENPDGIKIELLVLFIQPSADLLFVHLSMVKNSFQSFFSETVLSLEIGD